MSAARPQVEELEDRPLVFRWPGRNVNLAIPIFLGVSLLLHAGGFYLFQVVYPPTVSLAPAAVSLMLIPEDTEEGALLREWIRADDPALLAVRAGGETAVPAGFASTPYRPSFADRQAALLPPPAREGLPELPPTVLAGPVLGRVRAGLPPKAEGRAVARFVADGKPLFDILLPETLAGLPGATLPAVFLAGTGPGGAVYHVFLTASSGDETADDWGEKTLRSHRFPPGQGAGWREIRCEWITRP